MLNPPMMKNETIKYSALAANKYNQGDPSCERYENRLNSNITKPIRKAIVKIAEKVFGADLVALFSKRITPSVYFI